MLNDETTAMNTAQGADGQPGRLDLDEAIVRMLAAVEPSTEQEPLPVQACVGRVLSDAVQAPVGLPPFAASAMDGYAYSSTHCDLTQPLAIVGTAAAGHPFTAAVPAQSCVRIMTGAALPATLDTVVIQENVTRSNSALTLLSVPAPGANVRPAGHDIRAGQPLFTPGHRCNAFDVALLAAAGINELNVARPVRVGLISSGDELRAPGSELAAGQIFDANRTLLQGLLQQLPVTIVSSEHLADDPAKVTNALTKSGDCDLLITSGGVSVGDTDHLGRTLEQLGDLTFWRLNLKPGKPVAFGRLGSCWVLALPGNPVSTAVTALLLARPLILRLCGAKQEPLLETTALLAHSIDRDAGREEFQRGILSSRQAPTGIWHSSVQTTGDQSSNRLSTFTDANCLIRLDKDQGSIAAGTPVRVIPLPALLG